MGISKSSSSPSPTKGSCIFTERSVGSPIDGMSVHGLLVTHIHSLPESSPSDKGRLSFSWLASVARTAHELRACETKFAALSRIMHLFKSHAHLSFAAHHGSFQDNWQRWSRECGLTLEVEDAIEALNLSRLLFAAPRFPLALYACCLLSPAQLRNGVARTADGVVERLCDDDFDRCMRALPLLHLANHDSLVKTFAPADDWECLGAHRSAFPCEGKHGMRRIRDAYAAHMKVLPAGRYRPDLRDLLSSLEFKSVPYERLFAPGGESLVCRECAKRMIDRSQTLCAEEADNLEKYFFPEESELVEGSFNLTAWLFLADLIFFSFPMPSPWMPRTDHDVNRRPVPNEPETQTPPSEPKPESEWDTESESESKEQSGSPTDVEVTPDPLVPNTSSTEKPSSTPPQPKTSSQGGSRTSSDRSESPPDDDDEPRCPGLTSPRSRSSSRMLPPLPPRVELGVLALAAIGWE